MYLCCISSGSRPARLAAVALAAAALCCCSLSASGGIAARDHAVAPDTSTVTLPSPQSISAPAISSSDRQFDSAGHLIANAITDSSSDSANSWLVFWQGAPSQPIVDRNSDATTTVSDPAAKPATSTPLPIPVPNAFSAGSVGLLMIGCIMALRRSRRWLA